MTDGYITTKPQPNVMNIITMPLTNKEILEKAIQKAIDGGWVYTLEPNFSPEKIASIMDVNSVRRAGIIYSHDFAKALWGEGEWKTEMSGLIFTNGLTKWQRHLQNIVIAEDPVKYLGENI